MKKYLFFPSNVFFTALLPLIFLMQGCCSNASGNLDYIIVNDNNSIANFDFSIHINIDDDFIPYSYRKHLYFNGTYNNYKIDEKLDISECPVIFAIKRVAGTLSYSIGSTQMMKYPKIEADRCVLAYTKLLDERMKPRLTNIQSYSITKS